MTRRSRTLVSALAIALVLTSPGCRSRGKEDPILSLSASESLAQGKSFLERKKYASARPYFTHAFEVEPNSASGREALLLVADTLFLEGGDSNFIQSEAKYRDYQNRFPTSDRAPYVQFQIGASLAKRMEHPDRDQKTTGKALSAFEDLLRLYPTSDFAAQARNELRKVKDHLAEHEFQVGRFYQRYRLPAAAVTRYEGLLDRYPEYSARDRTLYYLGLAYLSTKRADDAATAWKRLAQEYPAGAWAARAAKQQRGS